MSIIFDWKFVAALGIVIFAVKADDETVNKVLTQCVNTLGDYAIAVSNR